MPNPLLTAGVSEIQERVRNAPSVSLYLEFDGALTPLVRDPGEARLDVGARAVLGQLSERADVLLVLISGRALSDLQRRVGIDNAVYVGNHGLEIGGRGVRFIEPFAAARRDLLARISESLAANLRGIRGARVEYKGLTASVHYRDAATSRLRDIERTVEAVVAPGRSPFYLDAGKMVLEVMPRTEWHKGAVVCWINSRLGAEGSISIYIGDNRTAETAFRSLSDQITVCVGNPEWSSAQYYLFSSDEVTEFLVWLQQNK